MFTFVHYVPSDCIVRKGGKGTDGPTKKNLKNDYSTNELISVHRVMYELDFIYSGSGQSVKLAPIASCISVRSFSTNKVQKFRQVFPVKLNKNEKRKTYT